MRWGQEWGFRYSTAFNPQMDAEEIKALKKVIAEKGLAPYWAGSPYVAETGSGRIENDEYSDSSVLDVPLATIPLDEMRLVEIYNASDLIEEAK